MMQTASITNLTPLGGFCMDFIMLISDCFNVSKAEMAALSAGKATASFSSQSCYRGVWDR